MWIHLLMLYPTVQEKVTYCSLKRLEELKLHVALQKVIDDLSVWGAKCVKNTYKCYICISPFDI